MSVGEICLVTSAHLPQKRLHPIVDASMNSIVLHHRYSYRSVPCNKFFGLFFCFVEILTDSLYESDQRRIDVSNSNCMAACNLALFSANLFRTLRHSTIRNPVSSFSRAVTIDLWLQVGNLIFTWLGSERYRFPKEPTD